MQTRFSQRMPSTSRRESHSWASDQTSQDYTSERCIFFASSYSLRTRARAHFAAEHYEAAVADFASAYNEAPSGSAEERAMKTEHRQAEVALKRSKTKDCKYWSGPSS